MPAQQLDTLIKKLQSEGVDISEIAHLNAALTTTRQPLHKRALNLLQTHWQRAKGELQESKELTMLLKRAKKEGAASLSQEERIFIKQQLTDFFRIFPAGLIASINAALPLPGTSLMTPWLLKKLGLLPSRWREANLLKTLQDGHQKLRQQGQNNLAQQLLTLQETITTEAEKREVCDLLVVWDKNQNGIWDPEEEEAYREECHKTKELYTTSATERKWFLLYEGLVFGPTALNSIDSQKHAATLIKFEQQTEWTRLSDIIALVG